MQGAGGCVFLVLLVLEMFSGVPAGPPDSPPAPGPSDAIDGDLDDAGETFSMTSPDASETEQSAKSSRDIAAPHLPDEDLARVSIHGDLARISIGEKWATPDQSDEGGGEVESLIPFTVLVTPNPHALSASDSFRVSKSSSQYNSEEVLENVEKPDITDGVNVDGSLVLSASLQPSQHSGVVVGSGQASLHSSFPALSSALKTSGPFAAEDYRFPHRSLRTFEFAFLTRLANSPLPGKLLGAQVSKTPKQQRFSQLNLGIESSYESTKAVSPFKVPRHDRRMRRAVMSCEEPDCTGTRHVLQQEGPSIRQRRSAEGSTPDWRLASSNLQEQTPAAAEAVANRSFATIPRDESTTESTASSHAPESPTTVTSLPFSGVDDVTTAACGKGGNWSCKGRCGLPPSMPCSCDALCHVTRHCCEDFQSECKPQANPALDSFQGRQLSCRHSYMMMLECLENFRGSELERRCLGSYDVMDDASPVSDRATGLVFANVHCARCNLVNDVVEWRVTAECRGEVYTMAEMLTDCSLYFSPPQNYFAQKCVTNRTASNYYHHFCPRGADPALSALCSHFHSYVVTEERNEAGSYYRHTWKNVHCLQCSSKLFPNKVCFQTVRLYIYHRYRDFTILVIKWRVQQGAEIDARFMGNRRILRRWKMHCNGTGHCWDTECPKGYVMVQGERCFTTHFESIVTFRWSGNKTSLEHLANTLGALLAQNSDFNKICPIAQRNVTLLLELRHFMMRMRCNSRELNTVQKEETNCLLQTVAVQAYESLDDDLRAQTEIFYVDGPGFRLGIDCRNAAKARPAAPDVPQVDILSAETKRYVTLTGSSLSVLALSLRVALQLCVPHFRSVLAKLHLALASSLLVAHAGFLAAAEVTEGNWGCWVVAVLTHSALVVAFLCLNAFTFHLWRSIAKSSPVPMATEARCLLACTGVYCSLFAAVLIGTAVTLDLVLPDHMMSPRYAGPSCWFNSRWGFLTFFSAPCSLICVGNIFFLTLTLQVICRQYVHSRERISSTSMADVRLAVRLVVLTSVTCLLGVVASLSDIRAVWMTFTLLQSLLGFTVGLSLVLSRRTIQFYRQKLREGVFGTNDSQPNNTA